MSEPLFHIALAAAWSQTADPYVPADFEREGFVHCSTSRQVIDTANRYFHGRSDLVLLMIDVHRIDAPIQYENLSGGSELFPHIYSALPCDAVIAVQAIAASDDGSFDPSVMERFDTDSWK